MTLKWRMRFIVIFMLLLPINNIYGQVEGWRVFQSEHFNFYYQDETLRPQVEKYDQECESFTQFILTRLNIETVTASPIECYIFTSIAQMKRTSSNFPRDAVYNFFCRGVFLESFPEQAMLQKIMGSGSEFIGIPYFYVLKRQFQGENPHLKAAIYLKLKMMPPLEESLKKLEGRIRNPSDSRISEALISFLAWIEEKFGSSAIFSLFSGLESDRLEELNLKLQEICHQNLATLSLEWQNYLQTLSQDLPEDLDLQLYERLSQDLEKLAQNIQYWQKIQDEEFQEEFFTLIRLSSYYLSRLDLNQAKNYYNDLHSLLEEEQQKLEREKRAWVYPAIGLLIVLALIILGLVLINRRRNK